ncbi:MAG: porin [Desulfobacterales bacterium]|nr:porin [Desulfobacterales bacterium]
MPKNTSSYWKKPEGGWGAWETALRYSTLDFADKDVDAGNLNNYTLGLNGYLYPNLRIMLNYIYADLESAGVTRIFQTRFQIDF